MRLPELVPGTLIRRHKRFLAEVQLPDGTQVTAHCPNTGAMTGLTQPGSRVWLSRADKPGRKLAWTWELVETMAGVLVGIHTGRANALVAEAVQAGLIPALIGHTVLRSEVTLPGQGRLDLLLNGPDGRPCWVEVKNVTAAVAAGTGYFPDAASRRAARHMEALVQRVQAGERAAVIFCVQRPDVERVCPAAHIDPDFTRALMRAAAAGVEIYALGASVELDAIRLMRNLNVSLIDPHRSFLTPSERKGSRSKVGEGRTTTPRKQACSGFT
jgi:sugar fermentation stimulation protein A